MKGVNFVPRHLAATYSGLRKLFGLNKPGWVGFLPYGRLPHGVAASQSGIIFLLKLRHHAHRNQILRRPAAHQIPHNYSGPIAQAGSRNGKAITRLAHRTRFAFAGNKEAAFSSIILCNSVF